MTEGMGNSEWLCAVSRVRECPADVVRSLQIYLAVGQPPGQVAHHVPISPYITGAQTHRAEPLYLCGVVRNHCPRRRGRPRNGAAEGIAQINAVSFESTL